MHRPTSAASRTGLAVLLLLVVAGLVAGVSGRMALHDARDALVREVQRGERLAAEERAAELGQRVDQALARVALGAQRDDLARALVAGDTRALAAGVDIFVRDASIARLTLRDPSGAVLASSPPALDPLESSLGTSATRAVPGAIRSHQRVLGGDGSVLGYVDAEISLSMLMPRLLAQPPLMQANVTVATRAGDIIATGLATSVTKVAAAPLLAVVRSGVGGMAEYRSKRLHQWRIAAVAPVPRHDWMVIVAADRREAYTPGRHLTITLGTHVGVAVVIVLACLALVALLLARTRRRLEARHSMAEALSMTDPLTGLGNRRSLGRRAEQLAGSGQPAAAVLVDLDHFKQLNDTYGHAAGDRALQHVASAVRSVVRGDDEVVRLGGDELVVVMPGGDIAAAIATALRIRAGVDAIDDPSFGTLSVSVGVAASDGPLVLGDLLDSADAHLYEDKRRRSSRLASQ